MLLPSPVAGTAILDSWVQAREGIKTQQVLIDMKGLGQGPLPRDSNTTLVEAGNKTIQGMDSAKGHCFVSMRWLNNRGILLELDSDGAMGWLSQPAIRRPLWAALCQRPQSW